MPADQIISDERGAVAAAEWDAYDFGDFSPADASGFSHEVNGSDEWVRPVFFENTEKQDAPTVAGHFVVRFEPGSTEVAEVYALCGGSMIGRRGESQAPDPAF